MLHTVGDAVANVPKPVRIGRLLLTAAKPRREVSANRNLVSALFLWRFSVEPRSSATLDGTPTDSYRQNMPRCEPPAALASGIRTLQPTVQAKDSMRVVRPGGRAKGSAWHPVAGHSPDGRLDLGDIPLWFGLRPPHWLTRFVGIARGMSLWKFFRITLGGPERALERSEWRKSKSKGERQLLFRVVRCDITRKRVSLH